jgi:threonine synthase
MKMTFCIDSFKRDSTIAKPFRNPFERYLFHLAGNDPQQLALWMHDFESSSSRNQLTIQGETLRRAQTDFKSGRADTAQTVATIRDYATTHNYVLCPHSAVGVAVMRQLQQEQQATATTTAGTFTTATVCLATAHEAKFPDAVRMASVVPPPPPLALAELAELPTRRTELPNDLAAVQAFVREHCSGGGGGLE